MSMQRHHPQISRVSLGCNTNPGEGEIIHRLGAPRSQAGKTALVEAVEKKHMDLADILLSHGCGCFLVLAGGLEIFLFAVLFQQKRPGQEEFEVLSFLQL